MLKLNKVIWEKNTNTFHVKVKSEWDRSDRYGLPLSLAVLKINRFITLLRQYGPETGERIMQNLKTGCRSKLRDTDFIIETDAGEFSILLPHTAAQDALPMLERLKKTSEKMDLDFDGDTIRFSLSIGLAGNGQDLNGGEDLLENLNIAINRAIYDNSNNIVVIN